ncbi:MAG TPA: glycosyltransferase [Cyclobacteriaceae bacterium]|nr:glycosyltransferase [Cyclobacteriaceae bacterium]
MNNEKIVISVILVIGKMRDRAKKALNSVLEQENISTAEVLVVDTCDESFPPIMEKNDLVKYIRGPKGMGIGELKELAIQQAEGYWVAFIEEHVRAFPGWINAILKLDRKYDGMGGEVHNLNAGERFSTPLHYCNYYRWLPGAPGRESELIAGHNSVYHREVLLGLGEKIANFIQHEFLLSNYIKQRSGKLLFNPDFKLGHINESGLYEITRAYFYWHKCAGAALPVNQNWKYLRLIVYVALSSIKPFYKTAKIFFFLITNNPRRLFEFTINSPWIFYIHAVACSGLVAGRLFELKNAKHILVEVELDADRTNIPNL